MNNVAKNRSVLSRQCFATEGQHNVAALREYGLTE
jgi:hypothetical protein